MAAPAERARQLARERDRVALDHHVEVEALLAEQHVAHRAAHEVHALVGGGDRLRSRAAPRSRRSISSQALPHRRGRLGVGRRPLDAHRLVQRAQHVAARDDALGCGRAARGPRRGTGPPARPRAGRRCRSASRSRSSPSVASPPITSTPAAHHALHRRVAEAVAHGAVEVLARHDAGQVAVLGHLDSAQAEPLALDERGRDLGRCSRRRAPGRDITCRARSGSCATRSTSRQHALEHRVRIGLAHERRRGLRVAAAAERLERLVDATARTCASARPRARAPPSRRTARARPSRPMSPTRDTSAEASST